MEVDYIVVGQGIAGSCMAFELMRRGLKVAVFDDSWKWAACIVAAGVINPITGKRLVKSWRSEVAHAAAKKFYANLEGILNAKFYHERRILQMCRSLEEDSLWLERINIPEYADLIGEYNPPNSFSDLNDSFGSYFINRSAWVECPVLMKAFKSFFEGKKVLIESPFSYETLKLDGECLEYENLSARKIIFCEGWRVRENPFFKWLPMRPAKGEVLTLKSNAILPDHILHRGHWIMKYRDFFRVGSTWDRENLNCIPTPSARAELLSAAENILPKAGEFAVIEHSCGIRPCTATTRPHIGVHPKDNRLLSFNGFGSKGFALCPYFAGHFADFLECGTPLDSEGNLARHVKKFFR